MVLEYSCASLKKFYKADGGMFLLLYRMPYSHHCLKFLAKGKEFGLLPSYLLAKLYLNTDMSTKNLWLTVLLGILRIQNLDVDGGRIIRQNDGLHIVEYESWAVKRGFYPFFFFFFPLTRLFIAFGAVFNVDVTNLGNVRKGVFFWKTW